jgi:hypothetical protein
MQRLSSATVMNTPSNATLSYVNALLNLKYANPLMCAECRGVRLPPPDLGVAREADVPPQRSTHRTGATVGQAAPEARGHSARVKGLVRVSAAVGAMAVGKTAHQKWCACRSE